MNLYIQYHNVEHEGLLIADPPFSETWLGIYTRRPQIEDAQGRVFLIAGMGRPRRYFLWDAFEIEEVNTNQDGVYEAFGTGWQLAPPQELTGKNFEDFKRACANFVGFRCINDLSYHKTLVALAERHRPPGQANEIIDFFEKLGRLFIDGDPEQSLIRKALDHYKPTRALSIRQPHAEAILRGVKKIEYRSGPTKIRGRILIYASLGRYLAKDEAEMMADYGIEDVACDELPRGVIVGTVELYKCDGGKWHVRNPERATELVAPTNQPQPVWFYPF